MFTNFTEEWEKHAKIKADKEKKLKQKEEMNKKARERQRQDEKNKILKASNSIFKEQDEDDYADIKPAAGMKRPRSPSESPEKAKDSK